MNKDIFNKFYEIFYHDMNVQGKNWSWAKARRLLVFYDIKNKVDTHTKEPINLEEYYTDNETETIGVVMLWKKDFILKVVTIGVFPDLSKDSDFPAQELINIDMDF